MMLPQTFQCTKGTGNLTVLRQKLFSKSILITNWGQKVNPKLKKPWPVPIFLWTHGFPRFIGPSTCGHTAFPGSAGFYHLLPLSKLFSVDMEATRLLLTLPVFESFVSFEMNSLFLPGLVWTLLSCDCSERSPDEPCIF